MTMPRVVIGQYEKQNERLVKSIKKLMIDKDYDTKKMSGMTGTCRSTHNNYMNDPEKMPIGVLRRYIRTLGIPKEDIIAALYQEDK